MELEPFENLLTRFTDIENLDISKEGKFIIMMEEFLNVYKPFLVKFKRHRYWLEMSRDLYSYDFQIITKKLIYMMIDQMNSRIYRDMASETEGNKYYMKERYGKFAKLTLKDVIEKSRQLLHMPSFYSHSYAGVFNTLFMNLEAYYHYLIRKDYKPIYDEVMAELEGMPFDYHPALKSGGIKFRELYTKSPTGEIRFTKDPYQELEEEAESSRYRGMKASTPWHVSPPKTSSPQRGLGSDWNEISDYLRDIREGKNPDEGTGSPVFNFGSKKKVSRKTRRSARKSRKSRKSVRKSRSARKSRKSRKSRKASRKTRRSTHKSVRKTRKSVRKSRKSVRKSRKSVRKSRKSRSARRK